MKKNSVKLNLEAESASYSARTSEPNLSTETIKPTTSNFAPSLTSDFSHQSLNSPIQLDRSMMGHNLNSFDLTPFETGNLSSQSLNIPKLESSSLPLMSSTNNEISQPAISSLYGQENIRGVEREPNILPLSQLINSSLNLEASENQNIPKQIKNILDKQIKPVIDNLGQYVNQMSSKQSYNQNQSDEMPTIPPTNLVFNDRLSRATAPPLWS